MTEFIPISKPSISQLEIDYVTDAVKSTWVSSLGKYIDQFEEGFSAFCGSKYGVAVSNGTVAIHLALVAYGIGKGDEVIVPDLSFIATANAILHAGATPIFVDIDPLTLCIDPAKIEKAITKKTKGVMPVHLYGHPSKMHAINEIAKKYNLIVLEDAAEAHGASIDGKKVGSFGHCATFSFYGNKNITTGEGGMITTDDEDIYHRCRYLRDHAMSKEKRYWHTEIGYNYRMTNLQAALGVAQLERIEQLMEKRITLFNWYKEELKDYNDMIVLNQTADWAKNSYWLISAQFKGYSEERRDEFMKELHKKGIDSRPFFYPMSSMPYFRKVDNPVSYQVSKKGINLPTYFELQENEVIRICNSIISII